MHLALQTEAEHAAPYSMMPRTVPPQALCQAVSPLSLNSGCCGCVSTIHLITLSLLAPRLLVLSPSGWTTVPSKRPENQGVILPWASQVLRLYGTQKIISGVREGDRGRGQIGSDNLLRFLL